MAALWPFRGFYRLQGTARGDHDFEASLSAYQEAIWHDWDAALPDHLHHYTSLTGMRGILKTRVCWATDIRHMNDITEATYAVDLVQGCLRDDTSDMERKASLLLRALAVKTELVNANGMHIRYVLGALARAMVAAGHAEIADQNGRVRSIRLIAVASTHARLNRRSIGWLACAEIQRAREAGWWLRGLTSSPAKHLRATVVTRLQ
jgi:hypothetical protein